MSQFSWDELHDFHMVAQILEDVLPLTFAELSGLGEN